MRKPRIGLVQGKWLCIYFDPGGLPRHAGWGYTPRQAYTAATAQVTAPPPPLTRRVSSGGQPPSKIERAALYTTALLVGLAIGLLLLSTVFGACA